MKSDQNELLEALSDIDKIAGEIRKTAAHLQELETTLYTIQKKIYLRAVEPQKVRN